MRTRFRFEKKETKICATFRETICFSRRRQYNEREEKNQEGGRRAFFDFEKSCVNLKSA
jgi:hypothetical protein